MQTQTKLCINLRESIVEPVRLKHWLDAGADAVMMTYSDKQIDQWQLMSATVREFETDAGRPIAFILDLPSGKMAEQLAAQQDSPAVEMIAVSASSGGGGIMGLRELFAGSRQNGARDIDIIAKLDSASCFENIEGITAAADAVMITLEGLRSLPPSDSPIAQKTVSRHCQTAAKPCLVERDSLQHLAVAPRDAQADVFDLANIVFDHADGVVLAADTFAEQEVLQPLSTAQDILIAAEAYLEVTDRPVRVGFGQPPNTAALAYSIRHLLKMQEIAAVAVYSISGTTARVISKNWIDTPILAFTSHAATARRMALLHGVISRHVDAPLDTPELLRKAGDLAKDLGIAASGERIIVVSGYPDQSQDQANGFVVETVR
ncbi:pyruvate kinase [Stieleria sp. TO1_6]|uniref:pyruvate kinase n=1 Tax=Stieleria tagensis TaxID=2956795 RepID=UPI00209A6577|nr:pyruvate kinase [Stieleria tagensis]MCO8122191.1 pyruvate kinase [Stieleria tagensis]